ncbi:uncharacterized protein LOC122520501 [Polistes fuscatus]|uniref:uncharacterized protein LOC122520501 n=1 Tax=Polistes fuscatus TaxID=30207 RepID=UPI001CAA1D78|nr:uncharacterized protein LOC122520501 [Polistes fuscatus]
MASEQRRVRSDTQLSLEDLEGIEGGIIEKEFMLNKKMDEIIQYQEKLFRMQIDLSKQQEELTSQRKEVELRARQLELRENELQGSLGTDVGGFRGYQGVQTPVDPYVTLSRTPNISRPNSPQPSVRQNLNSTRVETNNDQQAEIEYLRRELESLRRVTQNSSPLPAPRAVNTSVKLREIAEAVPKFDGNNISVSQFIRACRRALDSLPSDYTDQTETSLTSLIVSKLSGHAYIVVEGLKLTRVEQLIEILKDAFSPTHSSNYFRGQLATEFKRPEEHVLDYFSRIRELTQSIIEEEAKQVGRLERRVERKIEEEGLDAFIRGLPSNYRTAIRFEKLTDFRAALMSVLKIDRQIKDDEKRNASLTSRNRVANIRQIKENIVCEHCQRPGHKEGDCFKKAVCDYCQRQGHMENRCIKKRQDNSNKSGRTSPNRSTSQTKTGYKSPKKCSYCKNLGHIIFDCRKLKYQLEKRNQGNGVKGTTDDARRSPTPKQRPRSPSPKAVQLTGISTDTQKTLGTVELVIFGEKTTFHVIDNHFPISTDGILGNEFLRSIPTNVDYIKEVLIVKNKKIPFTVGDKVSIPPRTSRVIFCHVINADVKDGYIPRIQLPKGIYAGEALVENIDGKAYFRLINTTSRFVSLQTPKLELLAYSIGTLPNLPCDSYKSTSEVDNLNECLHTLYNISESPCADPTETSKIQESPKTPTFSRPDSVRALLRLDHLNTEEAESVSKLLDKNADIFHLPGEPLGCTNLLQHRIITTDDIPVHTRQYRFPPIHKEEVKKQTSELLNDGIIRPSLSPYNSPIWIVPKKSDSKGNPKWRMVIDYRNLNEKTVGDAYPIPNITEILDQLGAAKYFSTFDLKSGFHQIEMHPDDRAKTAFSTPHGHYEFNRMPFGLKNAPATFQRLMDHVLTGLQGEEMFVYLDDVVLYARSLNEHQAKFNKLAHCLRIANLKLQPDKCEFLRREVAYLGHIIGENGVKPDPKKLKAVKEFPRPNNIKSIRQFLGLAGYYRRFIPAFSKVAKPLTDLLKKEALFRWESTHENAFCSLRDALCKEPFYNIQISLCLLTSQRTHPVMQSAPC